MNTEEFDHREFDDLCYSHRKRIRSLPLHDQYTESFAYQGRAYFYDPDWDCFYPVQDWSELSHWERYGWMYFTVVLAILAYFIAE